MRVLMVLIALVATPFLTSAAQGSRSHDAKPDVRDVLHSDVQSHDVRGAKHDDDDQECEAAGSKEHGRSEEAHKHASRGRHKGWRHGQHDEDDSCGAPLPPPPPPPTPVLGGISGTVFFDMSYDGVHDADEGGLANWLVMLSGPVNTTILTDAAGNYSFTGLPDGTYTVCESQRFGWIQTAPQGASGCTSGFGYTVIISAGGSATQQDFGNVG